ncbi:hypothetical protein ACR1M2_005697, partial [Escherichia coli]
MEDARRHTGAAQSAGRLQHQTRRIRRSCCLMAHSITVRLNKPAREFQTGENIGFNIRAGVQYYDR